MDIKNKSVGELESLCVDIRKRILEVVSKNGGHLSSTLGATELIVAMHKVFDSEKDPFIFDVSHQAYAHKLLTGRWNEFDTLRQFEGICGYTKPTESKHDYFVAGHSSTSISLGVGAAKAIALKGEQDTRIPVVMIGDGSMTAGMVYEALNELGDRKYPMVIILNDNEMSIAKPIGAVSRMLSS
jgi:1-deoxy-D-xylulose-5-phosphate synthase